ncbi:MAG: hypothetical protein ACPG4U_17310 [Pseudomonadales bacterium]
MPSTQSRPQHSHHPAPQAPASASAIIDFEGDIDIHLAPAETGIFGISDALPAREASLAMLLDPTDLGAMLEHNLSNRPAELVPNTHEVLNIEDVLHREDSLDAYLPPDEDSKWYLEGDGRAVDGGISSSGMQDIFDSLLSQQLLTQNYSDS